MRNLKLLFLVAFVASIFSCTNTPKEVKSEYPMFWTWCGYGNQTKFDSLCNVFSEAGIDGLVLSAGSPDKYREAIPIAHKYGLKVYAWMWSINPGGDKSDLIKNHPDWFSVNRNGDNLLDKKAYVDYYKFLCPALPEVTEYLKGKTKELCEVEGLEGIAIDYHRFVDVILPTTLWSKYDVIQDKEYPEFDYGYHPAMLKEFEAKYGYNPKDLEDPSTDEKWLQFRCDKITDVANAMAEVVHSYGKVMAASPFPTPAMSRKMVRQDWGKWNLDIVFPMIYHKFYTGDVSFISDCTLDNVQQKNPNTTLYCGMSTTDGPEMIEWMDEALNNGAQGVAIFTANSLKSPETRALFRVYADSMRNLRATKGLNFDANKKPNTNPFENKGIMNMINMRMKAYVSLANSAKNIKGIDFNELQKMCAKALEAQSSQDYITRLTSGQGKDKVVVDEMVAVAEDFKKNEDHIELNLTDYKFDEEYGSTKSYIVTDQNSGITYDVDFYFYGGVISGWNIFPNQESYTKFYNSLK